MERQEFAQCPYCSEKIIAGAQKCRYCGEWLTEDRRDGASANARAVTKGIKKERMDRDNAGCLGMLALIVAIIIGVYAGGFLGLVSFLGMFLFIIRWYHRE
jgi:predicted nucleic acid-binding Zn ribbon protein